MNEIICHCNTVTKEEILAAITNEATSIKQIGEITKAGIGNNCQEKNPTEKCCISEIQKLLNQPQNDNTQCSCCK